ncbi:hypothetical protein Leryth_016780 [Lithospermum erythrorhizon]|nr:hypothetical protein Leryth_016780 [Lithospermum erythrorhizon]
MGKENSSDNSSVSDSAPVEMVPLEMGEQGISNLQQSQSQMSIEIEQIEKSIDTQAKMLQNWKEELWELIKAGNGVEFFEFLSEATLARKLIKGINTPIWEGGPPVLHIVLRKRLDVSAILFFSRLIPDDELTLQDETGDTALHVAIHTGHTCLAMVLLERQPGLLIKRDKKGVLPVQTAFGALEKELSFHLHQLTKLQNQYSPNEETDLLLKAISLEWFEMVIYILSGNPELEWHKMENLLTYFLNEPRAFPGRKSLNMLQSFLYSIIKVNPAKDMENLSTKEMLKLAEVDFGSRSSTTNVLKGFLVLLDVPNKIWEKLVQPIEDARRAKMGHFLTKVALRNVCREMSNLHLTDEERRNWLKDINKSDFEESSVKPVFFSAAQNGIHEMVELILDEFPEAIDSRNENDHSVLDVAAMYRQEKVFMIALARGQHIKGDMKLFQVAEYTLQSLLDSGSQVVFQMQRELKWFKEMEKLMPEQRTLKNAEGRTPIEVFKEKHQKLIDYENKWMLEMAHSCIVGGSLIATIVFAASITVPGGNNSSSGFPIFLNVSAYQVFTIANGLSLTFSLTSVLVFLSIFTARYSVNDYLYSLPSRIIFGLMFLFLAVTLLMVDFTAIMYLVSGPENRRNVFIVAGSACIPVGFFTYLQVPSLANMIKSTFSNHALMENNHKGTRLLGRSEVVYH